LCGTLPYHRVRALLSTIARLTGAAQHTHIATNATRPINPRTKLAPNNSTSKISATRIIITLPPHGTHTK
jgi:hypothetical protein